MVTVEYTIGASANDGHWTSMGGYGYSTTYRSYFGYSSSRFYNHWLLWTGVTMPVGATITAAYISEKLYSITGSPTGTIYFNDSATPAYPTDAADGDGKTKTTANVAWSPTGTAGDWLNSPELKTIIQELVDSYDYSAGISVMALLLGGGSGDNLATFQTYDKTYPAVLHIEYTEAASGNPFYAYAQQ